MGPWFWEGNELFDAHRELIATVRSDVIFFRSERLLVESEPGPIQFRARATTGDGRVFTLAQNGFTVGTLHADCAGRAYVLRRTSVWRKERNIYDAAGGVVARVRPLISGRVNSRRPHLRRSAAHRRGVPIWGCVLVDSRCGARG